MTHTYRITIKLRVKPANKEKRCAILGSGPAGLVSAKYALENDIVPVVFEKKSKPGGLWSEGTAIWEGMHTNVSRYSVMFSDFPWPKGTGVIPSAKEVLAYLKAYIKHFGLDKHLRFNSNVEQVRQLPNKKWQVTWADYVSGERVTEVFDYLICSTGLHCLPNIPPIKNSEKFRGDILHSLDYKSFDDKLKHKRVIVVGNSYSGVEISSHLVGHVKELVNVFSRPYLVLPRLLKLKLDNQNQLDNQHHSSSSSKNNNNTSAYRIIPNDMLFSRNVTQSTHKTPEEERQAKVNLYAQLCPHQTNKKKAHPAMYYELNDDEPIREAVTDNYYPFVRSGKILPRQARIKAFDKYGVVLDDGTTEKADAVIFCTGYKLCMDYFEPSVLKKLKFDPNKNKMPILLYKYTVHPDLENLAMVGEINGLFFAGFELQARWAFKLFKGEKELPPRHIVDEQIRNDEARREKEESNQYPHGAYNILIDSLAKECDALPDFEKIRKVSTKLWEMMWMNGTLPTHFSFNDEKKREISINQMLEVDDIISKKYYFTDEESNTMSTRLLAEKFNQHYKIPMHLFKD